VWEQALESASSAPKPTVESPEKVTSVDWVQLRIDGWLMISCPRGDWTMLAVSCCILINAAVFLRVLTSFVRGWSRSFGHASSRRLPTSALSRRSRFPTRCSTLWTRSCSWFGRRSHRR
jgi:hypothetical protein